MNKGFFIKIIIFLLVFAGGVFVSYKLFDLTSSNSAIYFLRGKTGGIEVSRDILLEDADRLIFMIDLNSLIDRLMMSTALAKKSPVLELTWDEKSGRGIIKEFIPGGKMLSISFSRYDSDIDTPKGLFMGGDLPYGDAKRSEDGSSSGFGYFDGKIWNHIWCTTNEAVFLRDSERLILPPHWEFLGSRIIKSTSEEVIIESLHRVHLGEGYLMMRRLVSYKAGAGYYILNVRLMNKTSQILTYLYSWGDEPWVGRYGSSDGDIGWYEGGEIKTERIISPTRYSYAGFWDKGNDLVGEGKTYTGYANFVQWHTTPSYVFFSNDPNSCCSADIPLMSKSNRVIGIVWDGHLMPDEDKEYVLAVGMAGTGGVLPSKPEIRF